MTRRAFSVLAALTAMAAVGLGMPPAAAAQSPCSLAYASATATIDTAMQRIENARLTNSAAAMRAATDTLQAALLDIKMQLAPCANVAAAATDAHAGHVMPAAPTAPAAPAAPAAASPTANSVRPAAAARPAAPAPAADAHAGHVMPAAAAPRTAPRPAAAASPASAAAAPRPAPAVPLPSGRVPVTSTSALDCAADVDTRSAPRMLHQGKMYYFCTEPERAAFAREPAKYVAAAAGPVPAPAPAPVHAH